MISKKKMISKKMISHNQKNKYKHKSGSALALTMFILAGMLMVALSGSYVIMVGLKAGGIQSQSTKAYFAAEAGAEKLLFKTRNGWPLPATSLDEVYFSDTLPSGGNYKVYYTHFEPIIFSSVGEFNQTKRSVEIKMN